MRSIAVALLCGMLLACSSALDRAVQHADALLGEQSYRAAADAYFEILQDYERDARLAAVRQRLGDVLQFQLGNPNAAIEQYTYVITEWPHSTAARQAFTRLANVSEYRRDYVGAIEMLELMQQNFNSGKDDPKLRLRIARLYNKAGRYPQARIECESVLSNAAASTQVRELAQLEVAESFMLEGEYAQAKQWYLQLQPLNTDTAHFVTEQLKHIAMLRREVSPGAEQGVRESFAAQQAARNETASSRVHGSVFLHPRTDRETVVYVEVAATEDARAQGLMGRQYLPPRHGMWFIFPHAVSDGFWMKDTPLSLDIIFFDADFRVIEIFAHTTPNSEERLVPERPYRYVLEARAGFAKRHGVRRGSRAVWAPQPVIDRHHLHDHEHHRHH